MTSNDAQIDVLLRRYAGESQTRVAATEHLDPDELNAFAEGSLSAAARARYVSHLVDCDNCRQIISHLAISSGAVLATEAAPAPDASGYSWWKSLSGFFSPMILRYAAGAVVLITVAGLLLFVMRRQRESNLVAQRGPGEPAIASAVKPPGDVMPQTGAAPSGLDNNTQAGTARPTPSAQPSPRSEQIAKLDQLTTGDNSTSAPKSAKEAEAPAKPVAEKKAAVTQPLPSYAPPPPIEGQRAETQAREQENVSGLDSASGPRKSAAPADKFKVMDRGRAAETDKDNRTADDNALAVNQPSASRRASDEKGKGPRRDAESNVRNRNSNDVATNEARTAGMVTLNRTASEEKPPENRTAGGHKFRRQGNAWVDTRFKSSMTLRSVSRESSEFSQLDSGLRSIAQQLSGEVIVVWKSKAYVIR